MPISPEHTDSPHIFQFRIKGEFNAEYPYPHYPLTSFPVKKGPLKKQRRNSVNITGKRRTGTYIRLYHPRHLRHAQPSTTQFKWRRR